MFKYKFISGLEKPFLDSNFEDYPELNKISALRGERISVQLLLALTRDEISMWPRTFELKLSGDMAKYASVRRVRSVPALNNARGNYDEDFLTTRPALIPDVLMPLEYGGQIVLAPNVLTPLWIDFEIPEDAAAGERELSVTLHSEAKHDPTAKIWDGEAKFTVDIIDAVLPKQELLFTQWFHSDCLANYYRCEKWSDEHFRIIENFARCAKRNGINMLFTPLISPPLDNSYDTRDLQLAIVTKTESGYEFDWRHLERWLQVLDRVGIDRYEIGHLFTQGGAEFATKVMGTVNGEYVRLFEKDTPCTDPEYTKFLRALLTSFIAFMKARGLDTRCHFHISDEPPLKHLETYGKAKASIADILEDYPIMDALSHYDFYETGIVKKPVVILHHLEEFTSHDVKGLWTYNCCAPDGGYSNRFLNMSLARNRSICLLLYKYDIEGFLHWGYNFYNNSGSSDFINPFIDTSAGDVFPSGDPFSVYPADNGDALESMRLVTFNEAIQDLRAFKLCESLYSREEVIGTLEEKIGKEIRANTYINSSAPFHEIREMINSMIKAKV